MTDKPVSPAVMKLAFSTWWAETGQYLDPDASDVPWFDKRENLCGEAFMAGAATETTRADAAEKQIKRLKILIKETATSVKALRDAAVELVRLGDGRGDPLSLLIKMDVLKVALRATGRLPPDLED